MKLTKHLLDQVSYWTYETKRGCSMEGMPYITDVYRLYFKQWWKWRKTIRIPSRVACDEKDNELYTFYRTENSLELEAQLKTLE